MGGGFNTTLVIHTLELSVCSKGNKQLGGNLGCVTIRHSAARTCTQVERTCSSMMSM